MQPRAQCGVCQAAATARWSQWVCSALVLVWSMSLLAVDSQHPVLDVVTNNGNGGIALTMNTDDRTGEVVAGEPNTI